MSEPKKLVQFVNHDDFITEPPSEAARFWIDQLLPEEGIVLLWGPTSVGKSPVSWRMATSIANGTPFFTYQVKQGRVLYIELDTPKNLVHARAHTLPPSPNLRWAFTTPLQLGGPAWQELHAESLSYKPEVVFINTLRKAYNLPDKDSETPSKVYSAYQTLFPGATLVFIHHARKAPLDAENGAPEAEGFAGSQAWQNDAQVALHLHRASVAQPDEGDGSIIQLDITKSQVSAKAELLDLFLGPDGVSLAICGRTAVREYVQQHPEKTNAQVADALGVSISSVTRAKRKNR